MAAYCQVYGVICFTSPAGWLPVHRDHLRTQRSVTRMGKLYLYQLTAMHSCFMSHLLVFVLVLVLLQLVFDYNTVSWSLWPAVQFSSYAVKKPLDDVRLSRDRREQVRWGRLGDLPSCRPVIRRAQFTRQLTAHCRRCVTTWDGSRYSVATTQTRNARGYWRHQDCSSLSRFCLLSEKFFDAMISPISIYFLHRFHRLTTLIIHHPLTLSFQA